MSCVFFRTQEVNSQMFEYVYYKQYLKDDGALLLLIIHRL